MTNLKEQKQDYKITLYNNNEFKLSGFTKQPAIWKLIIGDNYEFLINSLDSYIKDGCGLVDVVYMDTFCDTDKTDWLNIMRKRFELAKKILSDKGVIFISVNHTEELQLQILCNEIFGKKNCVIELVKRNKSLNNHDNKLLSQKCR